MNTTNYADLIIRGATIQANQRADIMKLYTSQESTLSDIRSASCGVDNVRLFGQVKKVVDMMVAFEKNQPSVGTSTRHKHFTSYIVRYDPVKNTLYTVLAYTMFKNMCNSMVGPIVLHWSDVVAYMNIKGTTSSWDSGMVKELLTRHNSTTVSGVMAAMKKGVLFCPPKPVRQAVPKKKVATKRRFTKRRTAPKRPKATFYPSLVFPGGLDCDKRIEAFYNDVYQTMGDSPKYHDTAGQRYGHGVMALFNALETLDMLPLWNTFLDTRPAIPWTDAQVIECVKHFNLFVESHGEMVLNRLKEVTEKRDKVLIPELQNRLAFMTMTM